MHKKIIMVFANNRAFLFVIVAYLMMILLSGSQVEPAIDEYHNIYWGEKLASGLVLFKNITTQHTPLVYYILMVLHKIGIADLVYFRICFYTLYFVIWSFSYVRYRSYLGHTVLIFPILFALFSPLYGSQMLINDAIQAIMLVVAFCEVVRYLVIGHIDLTATIVFSLVIFCSVMVAFVSLFSLFPLALIVLVGETKKYFNKNYHCKPLIKTHLLLLLIVLTPFTIYTLYLTLTGTFENAIYWMYSFNRSVYPTYENGLGSNVLGAFIGCFNLFGKYIVSLFSIHVENLYLIAMLLLAWTGLYKFKKQIFNFGYHTLFLFLLSQVFAGIRGYATLAHSVPFITYSLVLTACMISTLIKWDTHLISGRVFTKSEIKSYLCSILGFIGNVRHIKKLVSFVIVFILLIGGVVLYARSLPDSFSNIGKTLRDQTIGSSYRDAFVQVIHALANENDSIFAAAAWYYYIYYDAGVDPPQGVYSIFPAGYEVDANRIIHVMNEDFPVVILYNPEYEIRGQQYQNFAPDFDTFIKEYYTPLPEYTDMYVPRKRYLESIETLIKVGLLSEDQLFRFS